MEADIFPDDRTKAPEWGKFAYMAAVCYTGNIERKELLMQEFHRVGLRDPEVIWSFPSPYRELILRAIPHILDLETHPGYWGANLAHYRALKTAYETGCKNALIVEDDCRFLNDISKIHEAMHNVPEDWDVLMLDSFTKKKVRLINPWWVRVFSSLSAACYIVNRKAMRRLIALYEDPATHYRGISEMRNCDHWTNEKYLGSDIHIYCANPNLAVQCYTPGRTNGGGYFMQNEYERRGMDLQKYAPYGPSINILYCVNSDARARQWMEYSIQSVKSMFRKIRGVNIYVASDSPCLIAGTTWIDARPYINKYQLHLISKVKKNGMNASPMQVFRMVAPWIKELSHLDRVLYLDIDTEIMGCGLMHLYHDDFYADVKALYEHSDHGNTSTRIMLGDEELLSIMTPKTKERLLAGGYFNSGVMLMNLARLRQEHENPEQWLPFVISMAVKHHRIVVDQDICNVVYEAESLAPEFNVMPATDVLIPDRDPVIIHYADVSKYRSSIYPPSGLKEKCLCKR